ncbi:hypothetical protein IPL85_05835 [Candidatus Saccharibacteria bacterium]|nr:MAG: hypothetical protein IPL85_05835 [Candidatus Saccharibacteria bacterium]
MNRKRLTVLLSVVAILGIAWTVYYNRHALFPSEQMIALRQLESGLDLPKPQYRAEADTGRYQDYKGAWHYERHIALNFSDPTVVSTLRERLLENSWVEYPVNISDSTETYFKFRKGEGDKLMCIRGSITSDNTDGTPVYVSLDASGELGCEPI